MAKRKAIGTKLRFEVFKRDGFVCQYCGATPPQAVLWVDHISPVCDGGGNEIDNLVTSCDRCNIGKGGTPLSEVPQSLKNRAEETREREEQLRGYNEIMMGKKKRLEDEAWTVADEFLRATGEGRIRRDWFGSIKRFIEKIGLYETSDAMEIAISRMEGEASDDDLFKYFCGVCWKKIREVE